MTSTHANDIIHTIPRLHLQCPGDRYWRKLANAMPIDAANEAAATQISRAWSALATVGLNGVAPNRSSK